MFWRKIFLFVFVLIILSVGSFFVFGRRQTQAWQVNTSAPASFVWALKSNIIDSPFPLVAYSGIVVNKYTDEIVFAKDINQVRPMASLTKVMTGLILLEVGADFNENLFYKMMLESDNKAAQELAGKDEQQQEHFIELMNDKAKELGLNHTYYNDVSGLSEKNVSTAYELARLFSYVLKTNPRLINVMSTKKYGRFENTNDLLDLPNVLAGKTGFTDEAGGCLGLITDKYISIILGAPGVDERFVESEKLLNFVQSQ